MRILLPSSLVACLLLGISPLQAGERFVVNGYAKQVSGGVVVGLNPVSAPILAMAAAPLDRHFVPPARVRWEVELTGAVDSAGIPQARALRTAPADYAWPSGEVLSPERFAGASNAMNPFENPADPLNVASGGPPDYDQDGVPDETDAFPADPAESADYDADGIGDNADPDDDNDGMPDLWEFQKGLNPQSADGHLDSDRDGFTNVQEYEADTNPLSGSSRLQVNITQISPSNVALSWFAMPGRKYSLWRLTTLSIAPELIASDITGGINPKNLTRDLPMNGGRCFYFLKAEIATAP